MAEVPGSVGTRAGLSLRLGQTSFSCASLLFMSLGIEFYSYTGFCYLVTIMGLVIPWSFTLAMVDAYSVYLRCPPRQPGILFIIFVGDWVILSFFTIFRSLSTSARLMTEFGIVLAQVLSMLTLAAACSTVSVADLLVHSDTAYCLPTFCGRYQISAAMAFMSWLLSFACCLFNLWLLPSLR